MRRYFWFGIMFLFAQLGGVAIWTSHPFIGLALIEIGVIASIPYDETTLERFSK